MLNVKQELQNYPPIDLKSRLEGNPNMPDNIRNSITLYNKALENLKMDSEDIAIIELKKAISMNPEFFEAMNLLGVCYSYIKEYSKALELFERVAAAEHNSVKALKYIDALGSESPVAKSQENKKKLAGKAEAPGKRKEPVQGFTEKIDSLWKLCKLQKIDIIKISAGFLAGMLLIFALNMGSAPKSVPVKEPAPEDNTEDVKKLLSEANAEAEAKYAKLEEEYKKLQKGLADANAEIDYYKSAEKLNEVEKLISERNFEAAADKLMLLKTIEFKEAERSKFDSLYNSAVPRAAWSAYTEGINFLAAGRFQEAANRLSKVPVYGNDWAYLPDTLYALGKSYTSLSDFKNAILTFQKIREKYPNSEYAQYAEYRLREINGQP